MARKYIKTLFVEAKDKVDFSCKEHEEDIVTPVDKNIENALNTWLEEKYGQVGQTIANFEMLDIKIIDKLGFYIIIVYTELRL